MQSDLFSKIPLVPKRPSVSFIMYRNDKIKNLNKNEDYKNISMVEMNKKISDLWKIEENFVKDFYKHKYKVEKANYFKEKRTFEDEQNFTVKELPREKKIKKQNKFCFQPLASHSDLNCSLDYSNGINSEKEEFEKVSVTNSSFGQKTSEHLNFNDEEKKEKEKSEPKINLLFFFNMIDKDFQFKLIKNKQNHTIRLISYSDL